MTRDFPLAGLLRLRRLREDDAAAALAGAHADAARAVDRADTTRQALASADLAQESDEIATRVALASRAALSGLLLEHVADVDAAYAVVRDRTQDWSDARRDSRAIERLEEQHVESERREELRAEQAVLDEIAGRRAAHGTGEDS